MYLREAWSVFKESSGKEISFSAFAKLRPQNIKLLEDTPREQCKCSVHENFILKLEALGIKYNRYLFFYKTIICLL